MHFLYYYTSEPDFTCKTTFPILFVFKAFFVGQEKAFVLDGNSVYQRRLPNVCMKLHVRIV